MAYLFNNRLQAADLVIIDSASEPYSTHERTPVFHATPDLDSANLVHSNQRQSKTAAQKTKPQETAISWGSAAIAGGDGGIRTLDPGFGPDAPLAGECLRPLGHVSQTFGRAGSQRDEAKIIAGRTAKVNVSGTLFVPDPSPTTQIVHVRRADGTKCEWGAR